MLNFLSWTNENKLMSDFIYFQTNKLFVYIYKVWTNKKHDKITDHCNSSVMIKKVSTTNWMLARTKQLCVKTMISMYRDTQLYPWTLIQKSSLFTNVNSIETFPFHSLQSTLRCYLIKISSSHIILNHANYFSLLLNPLFPIIA